MNGYISKPLKPSALEETIEECTAGTPAVVDRAPARPEGLTPGATTVAFDREDFVERMMLDEDTARKIVRRFMEDMPRQIASLAQAVTNLDTKAVRLVAHSIKGAAANVSGLEMREIAWQLEQAGSASDLTTATAAMPQLSASFERARSAMDEFCQ
ncbi:MAG: Hpt domain-containing protein [Bryobacteraceae bacterium]